MVDNLSIQFLLQVSGIKQGQIEVVSAQAMDDAISKQEDVVYIKEICSTTYQNVYRIYKTNGDKLADFSGTVAGQVSGSAFKYDPQNYVLLDFFNKMNCTPDIRAKIHIENK
jgi:hypothetical protein